MLILIVILVIHEWKCFSTSQLIRPTYSFYVKLTFLHHLKRTDDVKSAPVLYWLRAAIQSNASPSPFINECTFNIYFSSIILFCRVIRILEKINSFLSLKARLDHRLWGGVGVGGGVGAGAMWKATPRFYLWIVKVTSLKRDSVV